MAKCVRCGHDLELINDEESKYPLEEEGIKRYMCPYCGVIYDVQIPEDEEKEDYHYYNDKVECTISDENHGYEGKCPECGHYVIILNNFMRSEVWGDVDEDEQDENGLLVDDTIVDILQCPNCGASITAIPPKPSEEKDYPYFQEEEEDV
jgi:predicted RNA-binding Zn-ribbon protein involved in translation (DUF1610 family)